MRNQIIPNRRTICLNYNSRSDWARNIFLVTSWKIWILKHRSLENWVLNSWQKVPKDRKWMLAERIQQGVIKVVIAGTSTTSNRSAKSSWLFPKSKYSSKFFSSRSKIYPAKKREKSARKQRLMIMKSSRLISINILSLSRKILKHRLRVFTLIVHLQKKLNRGIKSWTRFAVN